MLLLDMILSSAAAVIEFRRTTRIRCLGLRTRLQCTCRPFNADYIESRVCVCVFVCTTLFARLMGAIVSTECMCVCSCSRVPSYPPGCVYTVRQIAQVWNMPFLPRQDRFPRSWQRLPRSCTSCAHPTCVLHHTVARIRECGFQCYRSALCSSCLWCA